MSLLTVGLSHRSAPVAVLERAALSTDATAKLLSYLGDCLHVDEAVVLSTCNRIEVYAEASQFHAGGQEISELLSRASGLPPDRLSPYLYLHYGEGVVGHLFAVAAGLESMVVGESQILGQVRAAYRLARAEHSIGPGLGALFSHALRVGKRVHAETGIDAAGASVVAAALEQAVLGIGPLLGRRAVVVGAGSMGALAAALLHRAGVADLAIANRTTARAVRVAASYAGRPVALPSIPTEVAGADLLISSTGSTGVVLSAPEVADAMAQRPDRPLAVVDLALPHDVDPAVRDIAGVTMVDLASLGTVLGEASAGRDIAAARRIVADEVVAFGNGQRSAQVGPTVAALRAKAAAVVSAEVARLNARLPDLTAKERAEVGATVHRVVDKLLHAPSVRVKELAERPGGDGYAEALRDLFDLYPDAS
ncbi:MAG: glutamyl-tRNA reductase [Frankiaceae bacterium]